MKKFQLLRLFLPLALATFSLAGLRGDDNANAPRTQTPSTEPISEYTYTADFGTVAEPGADNALWKACKWQSKTWTDSCIKWGFKEYPAGSGVLVPAFMADENTENESCASLFSPVFHMKPTSGMEYILNIKFYVPDGQAPGKPFFVRLYKCSAEGAPFNDVKQTDETVSDAGVVQSLCLKKYEQAELSGMVTERLHLPAESLTEEGNYRFAFMPSNGGANTRGQLYLTEFSVEEVMHPSLAVGQLISPVSLPYEGQTQYVSFFIKNLSGLTATNFEACFQIDNGTVFHETFHDTLPGESTDRYTFKALPLNNLETGIHHIRFWVNAPNDINTHDDTSQVYSFVIGEELEAGFMSYDFVSSAETEGWTSYSDTLEFHPSWQFGAMPSLHYAPCAATAFDEAEAYDDYLVSPYFKFDSGLYYKITVNYQAVVDADKNMGDKTLSVWMCRSNLRDTVYSGANKPLWRGEALKGRTPHEVSFFFYSEKAQDLCVAFESQGEQNSDGYIALTHFSVTEAEINKMDFVFDFDPLGAGNAAAAAERHVVFVDQDGNEAADGRNSTWHIASGVGYNSTYAAYMGAIGGKANDWMVFYPVYLEKDTAYHCSFYAKRGAHISGDDPNATVNLELYLQDFTPRYDLPFALQQGSWKQQCDVTDENYTMFSYDDIKVAKSGLYFFSIRNTTEVNEAFSASVKAKYNVYVDNLLFTGHILTSVQVLEGEEYVPYEARLGYDQQELNMYVKNFSNHSQSQSNLRYCYRIDENAPVVETPKSSLSGLASEQYKFSALADFRAAADHKVYFWVNTLGSDDPVDTVVVDVPRIYPKILPFEDDFNASSLDQWQYYPSSVKVWYISRRAANAASGTYAAACRPQAPFISSYLVSPIMHVEKDITYRLAFRYKRAHKVPGDSLSLHYAYTRFDQGGFTPLNRQFSVDSDEYTWCVSYLKFNERKTADVYISLLPHLSMASAELYIDDFSMVDSVYAHTAQLALQNLKLPADLSVCDTSALGYVDFWIKSTSFLTVDTPHIKYCFDNGAPRRLITEPIERGDSLRVRIPVKGFAQGNHTVQVWADMANEGSRLDDTLRGEFSVLPPATYPFAENFDGIIFGTGAVDVNSDGRVWDVDTRSGNALNGNGCLSFVHTTALAADVFFTDGFTVSEEQAGLHCLTFFLKGTENSSDRLGVRLMHYDENMRFASSVLLDTLLPTRQYKKRQLAVDLSRAGTYAVAFDYFSPEQGTRQSFYIDSVTVDTIPDPVMPENLRMQMDEQWLTFYCESEEDNKVLRIYTPDGGFSESYPWGDSLYLRLPLRDYHANTLYKAEVRGVNFMRDSSAWSAPVSYTTPEVTAPSDLTAEVFTSATENEQVVFACKSVIAEKVLHISLSDGSDERLYAWNDTSAFSLPLTEFAYGKTYKARVRALNHWNDSSVWTQEASFIRPAIEVPGRFTATLTDTGIVFACTGGLARKVLRIYTQDGSFDRLYAWDDIDALMLSQAGFAYEVEYKACVRFVNRYSDSSDWTGDVAFIRPAIAVPSGLTAQVSKTGVVFSCRSSVADKVLRIRKDASTRYSDYAWNTAQDLSLNLSEFDTASGYTAIVRAVNVFGDSSDWSAEVSFYVPGDSSAIHVEMVKVEVIPNNAAYGRCTGGGWYEKGTQIEISAVAYNGYKFVKWSDNVTANPRTVTAEADIVYTAIFEAGVADNETFGQDRLVFGPNPVRDVLHVEFPAWVRTYSLCNMQGKRLHTGTTAGGSKRDLDMQRFTAGVYLLRMEGFVGDTPKVKVEKIIKK